MATVAALSKELDDVKGRISNLERVVILGDGDRLPLAEIVRNLTKTVADYIAQKDKEEQIKKEEEAQIAKDKKAEWNKLKWTIISFALPLVLVFLGQAFIFIFKIYPILAKLAE